MNNSKIAIDAPTILEEPVIDIRPALRERATKLANLIAALENIQSSEYWKLLESEVFAKELGILYKRIESEKDPPELYRLQGEIMRAKKYTGLEKLLIDYRLELNNIRKKINA